MFVVRRNPDQESWGPWRNCLHRDENGKFWYATSLAKPTVYETEKDAEVVAEAVKTQFPGDVIRVDSLEVLQMDFLES